MNHESYRKIRLKSLKERSVLNFHPWIFSGAIQTDVKDFREGEFVEVFDYSDNFLALGYFHHGTIMVRILSFKRDTVDEQFWYNRLRGALNLRSRLISLKNETNAFRLVHGEGDHIPGLVIDIYNQTAVVQAHSVGIANSLHDINNALDRISELNLKNILNKNTDTINRQTETSHNVSFFKGTGDDTIIRENGVQFYVNFIEGQKTGFFLDQRENRLLLKAYSNNKTVLNTFSYSGGFSMYALQGGAKHVDSVDSSAKAIAWAEQNTDLNFSHSNNHRAHTADVFEFIKNSETVYDIIVLDPPAFAKHLSAVDKAVIGYRNLNEIAVRKIKPGGLIFTFSCSQAIDKQLFRKTVFTAASKTGRQVRILHQLSQGPDHPVNLYHPESEYLKGLVLQVD